MGGVAIWAMHFIGNRAIILYPGSPGMNGLQLSYSAGFTALSFFVPIVFLLLAYLLMGTSSEAVGWLRLGTGGTFAGLSICGMHYLVHSPLKSLLGFTILTHFSKGTSWYLELRHVLPSWPHSRVCCDCSCSYYSCPNTVIHPQK